MTSEQINAAIAEACGWKWHDHPDCMAKKIDWTMPEKWIMRPDGVLVFRHDIPDYCADLNAIHEAENFLTENKLSFTYEMNLGRNGGNRYNWSKIHATARQRAEAFLRTLGKWEEGE